MAKPYKDKKAYWRGRTWVIRRLDDEEYADLMLAGKDGNGIIHQSQGLIMYRGSLNNDEAITTILHEMAHEMFPEWSEPEQASSELGVFQRDLKGGLESFGVDLTPLLVE